MLLVKNGPAGPCTCPHDDVKYTIYDPSLSDYQNGTKLFQRGKNDAFFFENRIFFKAVKNLYSSTSHSAGNFIFCKQTE